MKNMLKKIYVIIGMILLSINCFGEDVDVERLLDAISHVESRGNPNAVNKSRSCVGLLQIKTILVDDCNFYLKSKGSTKRYTYNDRYSAEKSKEMFYIIQERYKNYKPYRSKSKIEHMIRLWNGGCGYTISGTQSYYEKVMYVYNNM